MISPVSNFSLFSQNTVNGETVFRFSFTTPTESNVGGYELYKSLDVRGQYEKCAFRIDENANQDESISTVRDEEEGKTYFDYTASSVLHKEDYGRKIYFYLVTVSTTWERSKPTADLEVYAKPKKLEGFLGSYDNSQTKVMWSAITYDSLLRPSGGINSKLTNIHIYRTPAELVTNYTIDYDTGNILSSDFVVGRSIWVIDKVKKCMWFTQISVEGGFKLETSNIIESVFDNSEDYTTSVNNIDIFVEPDQSRKQLLAYVPVVDTYYLDNTVESNSRYFYSALVSNEGGNGDEVYFPVDTTSITQRAPILRGIGNSSVSWLSQTYWRRLKETLVDKNYYNKGTFAIPIMKEMYNFKGYLGIAEAKVDIYVNEIHSQYVVCDEYGVFEFNIILPPGPTIIQLHARDRLNQNMSIKGTKTTITTLNIYNFFAILGKEYQDIWTALVQLRANEAFETAEYSAFENKVSPLIDLYKDISETDEAFRAIAIAVYQSYAYGGFQESLYKVLNAFNENIENFDHYEIFFNNQLFDTKKSGKSFVLSTSTGLQRASYYYAVTSVRGDEESSPQIVRADCRWWPTSTILETSTGVENYNVLSWKEYPGISTYNIYRCTGCEYELSDFEYLITAPINYFIDTGNITPDGTKNPPEYTITPFDKPPSVSVLWQTRPNLEITGLKKANTLLILLYAKDSETIPAFQISRLLTIFREIIPPEIRFRIIYSNNSLVEILA